MGRDVAIQNILVSAHFNFGLTIYNILNTNPLEIAIGIISIKLGIHSKVIISLIVAFLL